MLQATRTVRSMPVAAKIVGVGTNLITEERLILLNAGNDDNILRPLQHSSFVP